MKHRRVVLWFLVPQRIFFPHFMKKSIFYQLKNSEIRIPTFQDILLILCFMFIWKTTHISPAAMHTFARSQYNVRTYPLCPTNQYIYVKLRIDKVIWHLFMANISIYLFSSFCYTFFSFNYFFENSKFIIKGETVTQESNNHYQ